mmetsp:Transcript_86157/g.230746  ORF Transcript_86157/g.230746 Transcript_86157/m.230746 type:complete len:603 (-) Transcript_86157:250-2058(-)
MRDSVGSTHLRTPDYFGERRRARWNGDGGLSRASSASSFVDQRSKKSALAEAAMTVKSMLRPYGRHDASPGRPGLWRHDQSHLSSSIMHDESLDTRRQRIRERLGQGLDCRMGSKFPRSGSTPGLRKPCDEAVSPGQSLANGDIARERDDARQEVEALKKQLEEQKRLAQTRLTKLEEAEAARAAAEARSKAMEVKAQEQAAISEAAEHAHAAALKTLQEKLRFEANRFHELSVAHDKIVEEQAKRRPDGNMLRPSAQQAAGDLRHHRLHNDMGEEREEDEEEPMFERDQFEAFITKINTLNTALRKRDGQVQQLQRELQDARSKYWDYQMQCSQAKQALREVLRAAEAPVARPKKTADRPGGALTLSARKNGAAEDSEEEEVIPPNLPIIGQMLEGAEARVVELRQENAALQQMNGHLAEVARDRMAFIQAKLQNTVPSRARLGYHPAGVLWCPRLEEMDLRDYEGRRAALSPLVDADEGDFVLGGGGMLLGRPDASIPYKHDSWNNEPDVRRQRSVDPDLECVSEEEISVESPQQRSYDQFESESESSDDSPSAPWAVHGNSAPTKRSQRPAEVPPLDIQKVYECVSDSEDYDDHETQSA